MIVVRVFMLGNPEFVYFSGYVHKISAAGRKQKRVLLVTALGMYVCGKRHFCFDAASEIVVSAFSSEF